jgi:hypothetical protein
MLDDFLQAIDIPKSRIIDYPRYLFLCGGCVSTNGQTRIPASLRHTLLQKIATDYPELQSTILLDEDIFSKFDQEHYRDLLTFERDLALFCSAIVIILEGPGAIAGFGSFVLLDEVVRKLHAIIDNSHYASSSFICNGPIERLKKKDESQVISHDWLLANGRRPALPKVHVFAGDLIDEIVKIHRSYPTSHALDRESRVHHMLLLASLLRVVQPLKLNELVQFTSHVSTKISSLGLQQYLSLPESLNVIKKRRYGNIEYYANIDGGSFVNWLFQREAPQKDVLRWIVDIRTSFEKNDRRRIKALKSWPKPT